MIKALLFDLNGTLINILTNEGDDNVYRVTANFLSYRGVYLAPEVLKNLFFDLNRSQRKESLEEFPEFDVIRIFEEIITNYARKPFLPVEKKLLAEMASLVFRAASRFRLELYPGVKEVLDKLSEKYILGAVSDGQTAWAYPELCAAGLEKYFKTVIVSGDYGFRKPDARMYNLALCKLGLKPEEAIFVGNDMFRDVYGAATAGMKTVFFKSDQGDHSFHGKEADYIIYNFRELLKAVEFFENAVSSSNL